MAHAGTPAGRITMEPSGNEVARTAENYRLQKKDDPSSKAASASKSQPDSVPLLELHDPATPSSDQVRTFLEDTSVIPRNDYVSKTKNCGNDLLARRSLLDLSSRLDEHQAQSQHSFDSLQTELSKMRDRLASLTTSMASSSLSRSTTAGSTTTWRSSSPVLSAPSMLPSAATISAAPQVFGEMPQPYGFSNLDRRSVFRADVEGSGNSQSSTPPVNEQNSEKQTHHSQDNQSILDMLAQAKTQLETISEKLRHAIVQNSRGTIWDCIEKNAASKPLLAREDINLNCPSQQAVVEPECAVGDAETEDSSHAFVQVFTDTPEQQRYAVEQHESRQAPKCFSMPIFSPERPTVGDIDQLLNCPCRASEYRTWDEEFQDDENLLWEKSVCQPATGHSISIFPWDPGACVSTYPSWHPQLLIQQEGTVTHAPLLVHSRPTETIQPCTIQGVPAVTNCQVPALDRKCQQVPSDHAPSNETGCLTKIEWQPHHGIGTLSLYFCLRGLIATSVIGKQLSLLQISELEKWERQVTSVSYA